jgi:hypothetical protein
MTRYFLDCEFNGMGGNLISLALVSENGNNELYLALPCQRPIRWIAENVIPIVKCVGAKPIACVSSDIANIIEDFFMGDPCPVIVADWPDDISYFCKCLMIGPGQMIDFDSLKFEVIRVDSYPTDLPGAIQHNALWDARALRHKLMED